ncbi:S66 peptidase family protein [Sulfobacillus thermosulfidooxidans]|uniref:S66 peptidase family protein n=1 Tax=Sulfobacillus thermosulfidooxidans TaxID=28034 RepID=UPI0006B4AB9B|nr:LD-carboxypeptidase [Sulfobacillus thermosulfidooxidans]
MRKKPKPLKPGAHIRIVAPAGIVNPKNLQITQDFLTHRGYTVSQGAHVLDQHEIFAGKETDRVQDLVDALSDPHVDAVITARGGYGSVRLLPLLDQIDLSHLNPKCLLGYSDITALHAYFFTRYGWVTYHGPVMESDWTHENGQIALDVLAGTKTCWPTRAMEVLNPSHAPITAPWHGGNLTVLTSLVGTPYFPSLNDAVLFVEDVNEAPYRVDRMFHQLLLSGCLEGIRGIVWGEGVGCGNDTDPLTVKQIVYQMALECGVPAWYNFPAGHGVNNWTVPLGEPLTISDNHVLLAGE